MGYSCEPAQKPALADSKVLHLRSVTGLWFCPESRRHLALKHKEELLYFEGNRVVEQAAQQVVESPSLEAQTPPVCAPMCRIQAYLL